MKDDINSLSHSKWRCKYHIVFAPKYRNTHAGEHSPEYERSAVCGISEREKCPDDIRQARESEVQIRQ